jgi:hypothetical protein
LRFGLCLFAGPVCLHEPSWEIFTLLILVPK